MITLEQAQQILDASNDLIRVQDMVEKLAYFKTTLKVIKMPDTAALVAQKKLLEKYIADRLDFFAFDTIPAKVKTDDHQLRYFELHALATALYALVKYAPTDKTLVGADCQIQQYIVVLLDPSAIDLSLKTPAEMEA